MPKKFTLEGLATELEALLVSGLLLNASADVANTVSETAPAKFTSKVVGDSADILSRGSEYAIKPIEPGLIIASEAVGKGSRLAKQTGESLDNAGLLAPALASGLSATGMYEPASAMASDVAYTSLATIPFKGRLPKMNELIILNNSHGGKISRKKLLRQRRFSRYRK